MNYSEQTAFLSELVYDNSRVSQTSVDEHASFVGPNGFLWELKLFRETAGGYQGAVFKNVDTGDVVLVNRGTEIGLLGGDGGTVIETVRDIFADASMGIAALPSQFLDAEILYKEAIPLPHQCLASL